MTEFPPPIPRLGMRNAIFKVLNCAAHDSPGGAHRNRRYGASSFHRPGGSKTVPRRLQCPSYAVAEPPPPELPNDETPGHGVERQATILPDLSAEGPEYRD
jgi:hypothetical protein